MYLRRHYAFETYKLKLWKIDLTPSSANPLAYQVHRIFNSLCVYITFLSVTKVVKLRYTYKYRLTVDFVGVHEGSFAIDADMATLHEIL